jgi:hypothetical protein
LPACKEEARKAPETDVKKRVSEIMSELGEAEAQRASKEATIIDEV